MAMWNPIEELALMYQLGSGLGLGQANKNHLNTSAQKSRRIGTTQQKSASTSVHTILFYN